MPNFAGPSPHCSEIVFERWQICSLPSFFRIEFATMPRAKTSLIEALKKVRLFNSLAEKEREVLGQRARMLHFKADEPIFAEGEPCSRLYLIDAGRVKVFASSTNGREQILAIQESGSTLGELAILDGGNYCASATAFTDADLLLVRREDLQALCLQRPEVSVTRWKTYGPRCGV